MRPDLCCLHGFLWLCPVDFKTLSPDRSCMTCVFRSLGSIQIVLFSVHSSCIQQSCDSLKINPPTLTNRQHSQTDNTHKQTTLTNRQHSQTDAMNKLQFVFHISSLWKQLIHKNVAGKFNVSTITCARIANHMRSHIIASILKFMVDVKSKNNLLAVNRWTLQTFTRNVELKVILVHCICLWV